MYNVSLCQAKMSVNHNKDSSLKSIYIYVLRISYFVHKSAWYKVNDLFYLCDRICYIHIYWIISKD